MGLTVNGFIPETLVDIQDRIRGKLEVYNPGFDFSPDSPDGQLIDIFSFEVAQLWSELNLTYESYNPQSPLCTGAALRNLGLITGIPFTSANRSLCTIETQGTAGTPLPAGSIVADDEGNQFQLSFATSIPSNAQVVSLVAGAVPIVAGSITTIVTPVTGWDSVTQTSDGILGSAAISEQEFRNLRQSTVMRNSVSVVDLMEARLVELGISQAQVVNNSSDTITLPDGTPPNTIHVVVGELEDVTDLEIAEVILVTNALGCPTFGADSVVVSDNQGVPHTINFTKATEVAVEMVLDIIFLSDDSAGADVLIQNDLVTYINALPAGADVIWSQLFAIITPHGSAQINSLLIDRKGGTPVEGNISIDPGEFTSMLLVDVDITVTGA